MPDTYLNAIIQYIENQEKVFLHDNTEFAKGCKFAYSKLKEFIRVIGR